MTINDRGSDEPETRLSGENAVQPWDDFDADAYADHNYATLRPEDRRLLTEVRDFFAANETDAFAQGLDLGSGSNLYPALAMLPFCEKLTLWEYSARNIAWLDRETHDYSAQWDPFWRLLSERPPYRDLAEPRRLLAERATVHRGSAFDLPKSNWDIGTMFFVAESLTGKLIEFELATRRFIEALRPGALFAAAFMENSEGYQVGEIRFPAVGITVADVRSCLDGITTGTTIERFDAGSDPVREGYTGMIFALGRTGRG